MADSPAAAEPEPEQPSGSTAAAAPSAEEGVPPDPQPQPQPVASAAAPPLIRGGRACPEAVACFREHFPGVSTSDRSSILVSFSQPGSLGMKLAQTSERAVTTVTIHGLHPQTQAREHLVLRNTRGLLLLEVGGVDVRGCGLAGVVEAVKAHPRRPLPCRFIALQALRRRRVEYFRTQLTALYGRARPSKLGDVEGLIAQWVGREDELVAQVAQKYCAVAGGGGVQSSQDLTTRAWCTDPAIIERHRAARALPRWVPDAEAPACMLCEVRRSCACIGSPCLSHCVHGASIGGLRRCALPRGAGGGAAPAPLPLLRLGGLPCVLPRQAGRLADGQPPASDRPTGPLAGGRGRRGGGACPAERVGGGGAAAQARLQQLLPVRAGGSGGPAAARRRRDGGAGIIGAAAAAAW
jgi:hypothetical protein